MLERKITLFTQISDFWNYKNLGYRLSIIGLRFSGSSGSSVWLSLF